MAAVTLPTMWNQMAGSSHAEVGLVKEVCVLVFNARPVSMRVHVLVRAARQWLSVLADPL